MTRFCMILIVVLAMMAAAASVQAQNPFLARKTTAQPPGPVIAAPDGMMMKITLWQQMIRAKMAGLIHQAREENRLAPLAVFLAMAFAYGMLHAAGPGHGKAVAMSFMLSQRATLGRGLLFGFLIAAFHGLSGAVLVMGLQTILQNSVSGTLEKVSLVTQTVSYALIVLLGLGTLFQNGYALFFRATDCNGASKTEIRASQNRGPKMGLLVWAASVGMVPCPGVVMVMLFCLSMGMLPLGLLSAVFISLGMAMTISVVVTGVVAGRGASLKFLSGPKSNVAEKVFGLISGMAVASLGLIFLFAVTG